MQVSKDRTYGNLRIIVDAGTTNSSKALALDYRFTDPYYKPLLSPYYSRVKGLGGSIDTTLRVPLIGKSFKFLYRLVTPDSIYVGEVQDLAIGHLIGVAGQSNAEGWSPPPYPRPAGDMRVLRGTTTWEYGSNPSGKKWNGPWVYMANKLSELLGDGLPIGVVNAAEGGSALLTPWYRNWQRNAQHPEDPRTLYGAALRMFRASGANMEAMFWIQGEADVVFTSTQEYRAEFEKLVRGMETDFRHDLEFYHLQISGQLDNPGNWRPLGWGWIREAQRELYDSKLVGTAVPYPISFDGIHYEISTTETVGHRFAAALAHERYDVRTPLYPPIVADTAIFVDIDTMRPWLGKKVLLRCSQGDSAARFLPEKKLFKFEFRCGDHRFDTSRVTARVHSYAPGWIEVTMKDSVIRDTAGWYLSYAIRADVNGANVTDTCTASNLPNALVAFMDIPIGAGVEPAEPEEPVLGVEEMVRKGECSTRWFDLTGKEISAKAPTDLPPGAYLEVENCGGHISTRKWLITAE